MSSTSGRSGAGLGALARTPGLRLVVRAFGEWRRHEAPRTAAALAYYALMSLAPLTLVLVAAAGLAFERRAVREEILLQAQRFLQPDAIPAVRDILGYATAARPDPVTTAIAIGVALLGAAGAFAQLQSALNRMWGAPPPTGIAETLRRRSLSFVMVLVGGLLLAVSAFASAGAVALVEIGPESLESPALFRAGGALLSFVLLAAMFAAIYEVLPDVDVSWRDALLGGLTTSALFVAANAALDAYFSRIAVGSAYGAAGSLAVLLLWMYLIGHVVLFGAELTHLWACTHESPHETKAEDTQGAGP